MSIVLVNHKVKDFNAWKPYFDADQERRSAAGLKDVYVTRKADDPNDVFMVFETEDADNAMKMMEDPNLKDVMDQAGVINRPTITVLNKA